MQLASSSRDKAATIDPPELSDKLEKTRGNAIALALGGGAARGWAHIGVLHALDEAGFRIAMIAGTSIGALVGGCYLAGKLDELETFARSLSRRRMLGLLDIQFAGSGLFGGMRLNREMESHMRGVQIEELRRPFVAVATEISTGHEIWLTHGDLVTAVRASYSLPGIFEPVECNGKVLVDGALVNPVPVSVCRAYEQPRVVAVNLNYDLFGRSGVVKHGAPRAEMNVRATAESSSGSLRKSPSKPVRLGISGVMVESYNIIQDRISRARLAGDPPDYSLHPRLSDIGLADFHRASEAIDLGYEVTMDRLPDLRRLAELA
ncbi:patatin-like phospholipase family protein [Oricola thermophila]|uniref:Patatin-like phospholipase family protein n=1 Tax=Oricola thermophila TaxID=2742145 RepID=A0A6N1VBL3_9HYPH|nr:patatin-like phospholipase family protein [Oricola thermophila]QKV18078.1 patatin-like phospholipase family protein [Oricola thermophila]